MPLRRKTHVFLPLSLPYAYNIPICPTLASWSSSWLLADLISWTLSLKATAVAWTCFCISLNVCSRSDSTRTRRDTELAFCCSALAMLISERFSHCCGVIAKLGGVGVKGALKDLWGRGRKRKRLMEMYDASLVGFNTGNDFLLLKNGAFQRGFQSLNHFPLQGKRNRIIHLCRAVVLLLCFCKLLAECVVIKAHELSMHWASDFSFRPCSSRYLVHRFNLEHKQVAHSWFLKEQRPKRIQISANVSDPFECNSVYYGLPYRICSVICSTTRCRVEATPSITSFSLCSSLSTSSCNLSEGWRFILRNTEQEEHDSCWC